MCVSVACDKWYHYVTLTDTRQSTITLNTYWRWQYPVSVACDKWYHYVTLTDTRQSTITLNTYWHWQYPVSVACDKWYHYVTLTHTRQSTITLNTYWRWQYPVSVACDKWYHYVTLTDTRQSTITLNTYWRWQYPVLNTTNSNNNKTSERNNNNLPRFDKRHEFIDHTGTALHPPHCCKDKAETTGLSHLSPVFHAHQNTIITKLINLCNCTQKHFLVAQNQTESSRVVSHWNSVSSHIVDADTVLTCKKSLDACNKWDIQSPPSTSNK